tara:strand:+ start:6076 stop:7161 length:1086 start_codon:yes stop_codon:yes gene_type:complete
MSSETIYQHGSSSKTGILLINLGTPDAPTPKALKPYLKEFLSNSRVIEIPRWIWWTILNFIILNIRPKKSAEKYSIIWTKEGSPLKIHTERQAELLLSLIKERTKPAPLIEYAMSIGNPSISETIIRMKQQNCERILVLPLYPQYAASSTGAAFDSVFNQLKKMRDIPAIRTVKHYHDHPAYINALAQNVRDYWLENGEPDKLIISFHGVPRFSLDKGDPYHCECQKTGRLLAETLNLDKEKFQICFQSRFGRTEWLRPYTAEILEQLGTQNTGRVDVICPGFVSDCLETLEEIAIEGKTTFIQAGGKEFHYIPCLNERDDWIHALTDIALNNLEGWLGLEESKENSEQSRKLAVDMGAKN